MCNTQCIQPVHPEQDIQKEHEIVISFCMFPMFVKETVELYMFGSTGLQYPTVISHYFISILTLYLKTIEVCDKLLLPKIKDFLSLRFYCWTGKEQRAWSIKAEGKKGNIALLTHSVSEKHLTVTKLMLGAASSGSSSGSGGGGGSSSTG